MGEDKLRPGQRGIVQRFPGTAGDLLPTDQDADVEGHRRMVDTDPTPERRPAPQPLRDRDGEDDVEGHLYRPRPNGGE